MRNTKPKTNREIKFKFYYKDDDKIFFRIKTLEDLIENKHFGIVGEEFHISQSTGLYDKHDNEIYEDDKLNLEQWTGVDEEIDEIRTVVFIDGGFNVKGYYGTCNIEMVNMDLCEIVGVNLD